MIVLLDEPKNEKWGSEAAAPIFSAIGREALRHMNVPPRDTTPVPIMRADAASDVETTATPPPVRLVSLDDASDASGVMPALQGRSLRRAMAALAPFDVALDVARPRRGCRPVSGARNADVGRHDVPPDTAPLPVRLRSRPRVNERRPRAHRDAARGFA